MNVRKNYRISSWNKPRKDATCVCVEDSPTDLWWKTAKCRRKVYRRVPSYGWVCRRHMWQLWQTNRGNGFLYWLAKHEAECKELKSKDKGWELKELMRELGGDS